MAVTIYPARTVITLDPDRPRAEAVAVADGRIVGVGRPDELREALGEQVTVDDRFGAQVVVPGLIDQHLHPLLGATTLTTEVIAPEPWVLPRRVFPAADDAARWDQRLVDAHHGLPGDEWLFSWGYHRLWHGDLDRARLDRLVGDRPAGVWQRSCHEWFLNTAALEALEVTPDIGTGHGPAGEQLDVDRGHFWENGWMVVLADRLLPVFLTEARFRSGLAQLAEYLHMNGVTAVNEPGIVWGVEPWALYQEILGADEVPFESTFLVDARTQSVRGVDPGTAPDEARGQIRDSRQSGSPAGTAGKVRLLDGHVKLFADGAVISQLMQMRDGYVDAGGRPDPGHHGEWIMEPDTLRAFFDVYWDDGWQPHVHVNGDLGLDVVLDVLQDAQRRRPRLDHRTVVVHFANSTEDQVDRIARLGAIVSANPYYPVGFADRFREVGLGPERADAMVRAASVRRRDIPLSFHSDLPMGPADPLAMMGFAVNRLTPAGRVAGPDQRVGVTDALHAVTLGAAHSWRREDELGSIEVGKAANLTVLADDPLTVDPRDLGRISVVGTVYAGRWFPVPEALRAVRDRAAESAAASGARPGPTALVHEGACGCGCTAARCLADHVARAGLAA